MKNASLISQIIFIESLQNYNNVHFAHLGDKKNEQFLGNKGKKYGIN